MGSGPTATEEKVIKTRQDYGSGVGIGGASDSSDSCLFTVKSEILVDSTLTISVGDIAVLVPNVRNQELDLYLNGILVGPYSGKSVKRIARCISQNYIYEGAVDSVAPSGGGLRISFSLTGKKK